ncbi:MAG: bifunctional phosphopantothenoylcysteine decarboxylase/phosphopantothenate--cysteine ligase CoaBC [Acidimicrobiia bacterium]
MLARRRILLGVTGGVAAFKAAYLARRLIEQGAEVRSVMTESAREFLGPQTLAAITGRPPETSLFAARTVSPHTELARWADAVVVAPATAALLGRVAGGISDDLLTATILAITAPVILAPAMHTEMWEHPATQRNVATLRADGYTLVGPTSGALAGGDEGEGRMAEPEEIVAVLEQVLSRGDLAGWRVLVTAGGTREPIDPVRYVGNRSSGKMGHAIALEAAGRGAQVTVVTAADPAEVAGASGVELVKVETADDMAEAVWSRAPEMNVVVMAAAVADFRPAAAVSHKLRRADGPPELRLQSTPDVLAGLAKMDPRPFLVGFAAETGPAEEAAIKAKSKGVDLLIANDVTRGGSGFGTDTNEVTLIYPDGTPEPWELLLKREVARRLWDKIRALRADQGP